MECLSEEMMFEATTFKSELVVYIIRNREE